MDFENLDIIWTYVVDSLSKNHSDTAVNLWFSDLKFASLTQDEAVFITPTDAKRDVIIKHFGSEIAEYLLNAVGFKPEVVIYSSEHGEADLSSASVEKYEKIQRGDVLPNNEKPYIPDGYRAEYTFENFVVGSSNKFAHAAAMAVANKNYNDPNPDNTYNPLFIYGPSGVGKTHLMYAITNKISRSYPDKKITYVKGEEFTNQLIDSLQKKTTQQFKDKYRKVDVLLIDDIQFVAGKISTQEELFNTFNAVYEEHKQIILTSDRPPDEIKTLEDRLKTRFMSGIMADISLPDFDLRLAILSQKANQNHLEISPEILRYLAENIPSSIRQLEGVIKKLGAIKLLEGGELTFDRVHNSIKEFIQTKESDTKKMDDIILEVSKKYGVSRQDIFSSKRNKEIAIARHVCIYIARTTTSLSQSQIGKFVNRDRTTVVSSEAFVREEMEKDSSFASEVKEILRNLSQK